ncbi:MAG: hypothetical protein RLP09_08865 [Sandaracinaceae bacterium]|nr:hypothetical protein [Myxococcales bacterium]
MKPALAALITACVLLALGCAGEPQPLPAAECAPECVPFDPPPPPGYESACYDGCNSCICTTAGLRRCTIRLCDDAGPADGG